MTQEMLEILVGKYLDGEITPSEQRMLQAELDKSSQARGLLQQLQDLHRLSRDVVVSEVLERGKPAEEIIEQAWQQKPKHRLPRVMRMNGRLRFPVGLAAGLLIGFALQFVLPMHSTSPENQVLSNGVAQNLDDRVLVSRPNLLPAPPDIAEGMTRNVDWYSFTDEQGNQWLIQGLRENLVKPVAYHGSL